uniref:Uncharacterized protein n=1 Tax=Chromera velia CCMP2878 TaxID=1169474 RepID=A0A0K6S971_9ALVE|eukprot:Cvel_29164.t1-p1 / transcript=Cvel_29164.t1 / gene=Cvel_29164 / organism=Chromera_velia_CCMP2878 / gene_product=hypothetical protein / transcript_product=hypothetical protein / location=Cvel_scaffold3946:245-1964(-) / protein_length=175 / sequence_SO=supercontig / SO=protein_coding / is_pseudo=false
MRFRFLEWNGVVFVHASLDFEFCRAKAAYSLGRMEGALEDYRWILANSKEMMGQAASKGLFSEERPKPGTGEEIAAETAALEKRRAEKERRERAAEPSYLPVERKAEEGGEGDAHTSTPSSASAEPRLSLEETTTLLTELRDLYKRRVHVQLYRLEASRRAAHRQTRRRGKERKR